MFDGAPGVLARPPDCWTRETPVAPPFGSSRGNVLALFGLRERRELPLGRAQIVCRRNQNLQSSNARRDGNNIEQLDSLVRVHWKVALGGECRHPAANVAGYRLQFFYRDELNLSLSRGGRQR